jgi:hypothetical protein
MQELTFDQVELVSGGGVIGNSTGVGGGLGSAIGIALGENIATGV